MKQLKNSRQRCRRLQGYPKIREYKFTEKDAKAIREEIDRTKKYPNPENLKEFIGQLAQDRVNEQGGSTFLLDLS